jgi:hypothetical protein
MTRVSEAELPELMKSNEAYDGDYQTRLALQLISFDPKDVVV